MAIEAVVTTRAVAKVEDARLVVRRQVVHLEPAAKGEGVAIGGEHLSSTS
jgi:hypothetical protein